MREKTGMTLSLPGEISWSFWPVVGIKAEQLSLTQAKENAGSAPLVVLSGADLGLRPWSVIRGELSYVFLKASSASYGNFLIKDMSLEVNHFQLNQPFSVSFKGIVEKGFSMPLPVSFESKVTLELANKSNNFNGSGSLRLEDIQAKLNKSLITGDVSLQNFDQPIVDASLVSGSFEVSDFINLKGTKLDLENLSLKAHLTLDGTSQDKVPSTLNGNIQITVKGGVLKGVDVGQVLAKIRQTLGAVFGGASSSGVSALAHLPDLIGLLPGNAISSKKANGMTFEMGGETNLGAFDLEAVIQRGVINNSTLQLNGDHFQVKGAGTVDLNRQTLNYRFSVYGMNGDTPDKYVIPFVVSGPLGDPKMGLDYTALNDQLNQLIQDQAKNAIIQKVSQSVTCLPGLVSGLLGS